MVNINYWHMQIHPDDQSFSDDHVYSILEHKKIIGLGNWSKGEEQGTIGTFRNEMQVNDVVAIKNGSKLIALVQVIGGCYEVKGDDSDIGWIENRRPIRVLDWEIEEKLIPQPRGTLQKCVNDVETTRVVKGLFERVIKSFNKRKISISV